MALNQYQDNNQNINYPIIHSITVPVENIHLLSLEAQVLFNNKIDYYNNYDKNIHNLDITESMSHIQFSHNGEPSMELWVLKIVMLDINNTHIAEHIYKYYNIIGQEYNNIYNLFSQNVFI